MRESETRNMRATLLVCKRERATSSRRTRGDILMRVEEKINEREKNGTRF